MPKCTQYQIFASLFDKTTSIVTLLNQIWNGNYTYYSLKELLVCKNCLNTHRVWCLQVFYNKHKLCGLESNVINMHAVLSLNFPIMPSKSNFDAWKLPKWPGFGFNKKSYEIFFTPLADFLLLICFESTLQDGEFENLTCSKKA